MRGWELGPVGAWWLVSVYNCYLITSYPPGWGAPLLSHPQQLRYGHEPSVAQQGSPPTGRCRVLQREYLNYYHENRGQKSFVPSSFPHQDNEHFLNKTILFGYSLHMQICPVDTHTWVTWVTHCAGFLSRVIKSHQRSCWSQWAVSGPSPAPTLQVVHTNTGPHLSARQLQPGLARTAQSSLECRRVNTSVPRVRASNNTHPWPLVTRPNCLWGLWQVHHDVRVRRPLKR